MKTLELRSDTFTRPGAEMLQAMMAAPVGDDVFQEDPTINQLERRIADTFGMEAALFCASGTMTNQIAMQVHLCHGDEVICERESHVYLYEGGGIAALAGASTRTLQGHRGLLTAADLQQAFNDPSNIHLPITRLVSLENTANRGGGACYRLEDLQAIKDLCQEKNAAMHLDGARLFNALAATGQSPLEYGKLFNTISICFSKGLGAPVGSALLGTNKHIARARRIRKRMGGGWRQGGFLAAAALFALDHQVERLKDDHRRAKHIEKILQQRPEVEAVLPVETNIVVFKVKPEVKVEHWLTALKSLGILALPFGPQAIRMITHIDFTEEDLNAFEERMNAWTYKP